MIFETSQNSFSCRPPFGPFRSVKYLSFGQKLPIWTTHHTFLESRYPENAKNPYYVFSPEGSQKKYQLMNCVSLSGNLIVKLIWICKIQWWCSLFQFLTGNTFLSKFGSKTTKIKIVISSWNFVLVWLYRIM